MQRNNFSKKKLYPPTLSDMVNKLDRTKVFNFSKPHFITSLNLRLVEKTVNSHLEKQDTDLNLFEALRIINAELNK